MNARAVYLLFALSGSIGLLYEGLWARYLKLILGHSAYGQVTTLCIYMGGLGIGSFIGAMLARRSRAPLKLYALIELAAGVGGLMFHETFVALSGWFFESAGVAQLGPVASTVARVALCAALTAPVTILLGMTFPCLALALMRLARDSGASTLPMLYFVNSAGAAAGIMAASYVLIPALGTAGTLRLAGALNLVVALGFWLISRGAWVTAGAPATVESAPATAPSVDIRRQAAFWLAVSALTGFSSFVYEIGWIRLLSLVLGSATHSFDIMVSAFIAGLALGGLYSRRLIGKAESIPRTLAMVQVAMGLCALATIYAYRPFFMAMNQSHTLFEPTGTGFALLSVFKYGLCLLMMLPACFFAGMTLPLITCHITRQTGSEVHTGTVYGFNTIGAILGAAAGGLILLPAIQLKFTIATGALIDIALGVAILAWVGAGRRTAALAWIAAMVALAPLAIFDFDSDMLCAGQYRSAVPFVSREGTVIRHGATATISFQHTGSDMILKSNGKVDASLNPEVTGERDDDEYTQAALAFYPIQLVEGPYRAAMIGFGSGMTAHHLLADDRLKALDIVEIEREVPRVARGFLPHNRRAYEDSRVRVIVDDARSFFHATRAKYDVIISEPSNPWVSGVAGLFTREFYGRMKGFLAEGGMLVQWMHVYEFTTPLLLSIVRAIEEHFGECRIYRVPDGGDVVIIAWNGPARDMGWREAAAMPAIADDLGMLRVDGAFFGPRNYLLSSATLGALVDSGPVNSDFVPVVESGAERAFFMDERVDLFEPFTDCGVYYQEALEPQSFAPALAAIRAHNASRAPDSALLSSLDRLLDSASSPSCDWNAVDSVFYQALFDVLGTVLWRELPQVLRYRDLVYAQAAPEDVRQRFLLMDFASRGLDEPAVETLRRMLYAYPRSEAGATLIRVMAVVALKSGDLELLARVYDLFARGNTELSATERRFLAGLCGRPLN